MEHDTMYNILLQVDLEDLHKLCQIDQSTKKICSNNHFIKERFENIPYKIYNPMEMTLSNLYNIGYLITFAKQVMNFMAEENKLGFIFIGNLYDDEKNIKKFQDSLPDLYDYTDNIINHLPIYKQYIELIHTPNNVNRKLDKEDEDFGRFDFFNLICVDGEYFIYTGINLPFYVELKIPITKKKMMEFLINIFLDFPQYEFYKVQDSSNIYSFSNLNHLNKIINNPHPWS
jgi:hypothetical protein